MRAAYIIIISDSFWFTYDANSILVTPARH